MRIRRSKIAKFQSLILILFICTAYFQNYLILNHINNFFGLFFVIICIAYPTAAFTFKRNRVVAFFGLFVLISTISSIVLIFFYDFRFTPAYLTMPFVFLLMLAVTLCDVKVKYATLIQWNVLLLPLLLLLGGVDTLGGRLNTIFLNPTTQGFLYIFGYMVSLNYLLEKKRVVISFILLLSCALYFMYSGSRQDLILMLVASALPVFKVLFKKNYFRKDNKIKKTFVVIILVTGCLLFVQAIYSTMQDRFGPNYNPIQQAQDLGGNMEAERSAYERYSFFIASFKSTYEYPLGVGFGNTSQAMNSFNDFIDKETGNAHALLPQVLFSAGVLGGLIFFLIYKYLYSLMKVNKMLLTDGYILIFFILGFIAIPLLYVTTFWVMLAVYEKEMNPILIGEK